MKFILIILVTVGLITLGLLLFQRRLIYYPRKYDSGLPWILTQGVVELRYNGNGGKQVSYYLPPKINTSVVPERLWIAFGGNAALALDWREMLDRYADQSAGFLLLEYPGYGQCEGQATPGSILEATESAMKALSDHLDISLSELEGKIHLLGHSLGAAAALQYAAHHNVQRIVLIAPFTSMLDMATRVVGWPLNHLLLHRYDNRARLSELASRASPPPVTIIHGSMDEVIPVSMGRNLASRFPSLITFFEVEYGDHNLILDTQEALIFDVMRGINTSIDAPARITE